MLRHFVDKLIFAVGLFIGSQAGAFVLQYRQHLSGRLEQARADIAPYEAIAARLFDGELARLVEHHERSLDEAFVLEGKAIADLAAQIVTLEASLAGLGGSLLEQLAYLATELDPGIAVAVIEQFEPAIVLTPQAIAVAFVVAFLFSGVFNGCCAAGSRAFRRLRPARA